MYLILAFYFTMDTMTDTSILTNLNLDPFAYIRFILLAGFAAAIIGYALGNYLGIAAAYGTRYLLGH